MFVFALCLFLISCQSDADGGFSEAHGSRFYRFMAFERLMCEVEFFGRCVLRKVLQQSLG